MLLDRAFLSIIDIRIYRTILQRFNVHAPARAHTSALSNYPLIHVQTFKNRQTDTNHTSTDTDTITKTRTQFSSNQAIWYLIYFVYLLTFYAIITRQSLL